ncbi:probable beta-D-xylosidase 5 [Lycium ferocissimum]|uniref:probable beta-D-xylosidase 5 n=1 Tax=Lycium ferocissimum TaxID=112874 RepID=UPI0028162351|nr:probable beta-D-xylosidase 5 [Lycium ferocissimum]
MSDMNMRANSSRNFPGRTYRFYNEKPIYPFGHGLSYSTFSSFIISAPPTIVIKLKTRHVSDTNLTAQAIDISTVNCQNVGINITVGVKNNGKMDGSHVVLVFWKPTNMIGAPNIQLVGFERVWVKKGKTQTVTIKLDVCKDFSLADAHGKRKLVPGIQTIMVGSSSEHQVRHQFNLRVATKEEAKMEL